MGDVVTAVAVVEYWLALNGQLVPRERRFRADSRDDALELAERWLADSTISRARVSCTGGTQGRLL